MPSDQGAGLTRRQKLTVMAMKTRTIPPTAAELHVRVDVLRRLAEKGYVASVPGGAWNLTEKGRDFLG